jgi:hypothetical protein
MSKRSTNAPNAFGRRYVAEQQKQQVRFAAGADLPFYLSTAQLNRMRQK